MHGPFKSYGEYLYDLLIWIDFMFILLIEILFKKLLCFIKYFLRHIIMKMYHCTFNISNKLLAW